MRWTPRPWMPGFALVVSLVVCLSTSVLAQADAEAAVGDTAHLEWRNVGPVNMSGRVTDVEGIPGDPRVLYVGTASGGLWKTTDGGLRFEPIFDDQPIASIGDLALAPSNPDVIYAGSGEANLRNSVSFGNGVYKSTDGGTSWNHVGLKDTRHISRVLVHPTDENLVYVGAFGRMSGDNEMRGVFRSKDGGETWEKVLYLDAQHGVADMDMDPSNPNILYAGLWRFQRLPWTHTTGSEDGGIWKSVDGGDTWTRLTEGLPKLMGRVAVKVAPSDPRVVYVMAESDDGVLFRSDDRGATFRQVSDDVDIVSRGFYYTDLRVDPTDANRVYAIASRLWMSIDGGKTFERISQTTHVDYHSLWIDPQDPHRIWQGQDGGIAVSYDRGVSWEPIRNLPIAQLYQVFFDDRQPFYHVGGGLQDNGTWIGPSRTREPSGILEDDWRMMSFGDAYWVVPHPERIDLFLSEYQAGGILRTDMRTRQQLDVSPQPRRNDGGPVSELEYRFNWNAPIVASPHDPYTVYFAGNVVFKTQDFGDTWEAISPDLTTDDAEKQGEAGGPAWMENTTAEYHCTLISFAESPVEPGVLWAGSDDGLIHLSRDGGASWDEVGQNVPGVPEGSAVSHLEPDRREVGAAYAAFDRHLLDDYAPHIFHTENFGKSWRRISDGLPEEGWVWALRQDPKNPDLLWAGTELGLYATYDGGRAWQRMHLANFPTVAVHDIQVHPRHNDLVLGTHGRAIWIFDDATPLQGLEEARGKGGPHLFEPRAAMRYSVRFTRYGMGDKEHVSPNPEAGALISYYLPEDLTAEAAGREAEDGADTQAEDVEPRIRLEILDGEGNVLRELENLPMKAGLHRVTWDLATEGPRQRTDEAAEAGDFGAPPRGPYVLPGSYKVRLTVDGASQVVPVEVTVDPLIVVLDGTLEAQYEAAAKLVDLQSQVNDALRGIDALEAQRTARQDTAKLLKVELSDELEASWKAHEEAMEELLAKITRVEGKPFWSQGPRLIEHLSGLFGNIDGQFAAPTAAQLEFLGELETETAETLAEVKAFFEEDVASFSDELEAAGLPGLLVPELPLTEDAESGE